MSVAVRIAAAGHIAVGVTGADHGGGENAGILQPFAGLFRGQAFVLADLDADVDVLLKVRGLQHVHDLDAVEGHAVFGGELADGVFIADQDGFHIAELRELFSCFQVAGIVAFGQADFSAQGLRFRADGFEHVGHSEKSP